MGSKRVLIIGGGIMQIPSIKAAKNMGWEVIVADRDVSVPGADLADKIIQADIADKNLVLEKAVEIHAKTPIDGVFTAGTDFSTTVAWIADNLGLPGIPYATALDASDKSRMRKVLKEAGLPVPEFVVFTGAEDIEALAGEMKFPVVVKPVDNMGSRGIKKVESLIDLKTTIRETMKYSRSSRLIIENFIEGAEFSIDAVIDGKKIHICGIAERHIMFEPYFIEMGHTIPCEPGKKILKEISDSFKQGIIALGINRGAAKGDIKYSPNGAVIVEIAARLSGGFMSGWTFPYSSGINPAAEALKIAVGNEPGDFLPGKKMVSAERAFISIPGKIRNITGISEAGSLKNVKNLFIRVNTGDFVDLPLNNVEKCGNVIACAETREKAVSAAESSIAKLRLFLEPGLSRTAIFLFGKKYPWFLDAFRLNREKNKICYQNMAFYTKNIRKTGVKLEILPIPDIESESDRDWHGEDIVSAFDKVKLQTSLNTRISGEIKIGKIFWQAFLRGGVQGGVWLIETLMKTENIEEKLEEMKKLWIE